MTSMCVMYTIIVTVAYEPDLEVRLDDDDEEEVDEDKRDAESEDKDDERRPQPVGLAHRLEVKLVCNSQR